MDCYLAALRKYAVFEGRARRKEYWMFTLVNLLIIFLVLDGTKGKNRFGEDPKEAPLVAS